MSDKAREEYGTTGHQWDGIEELNSPLPRWWVWVFYATIVWGIGYTIAYPAWPLLERATPGLLGYSSRAEVEKEIAAAQAANAEIVARLASTDVAAIPADDELNTFAVNMGASVFRTWCAQCHGSGAAGGKGYPNLLDDDWLWGGTIEDIAYTVEHGIRNEQSPDARFSQMPAFGELLEPAEIDQVVNHVLALSGQEHDAAKAEAGAEIFADQCAGCHGDDGKGTRALGAPDLTDAIWLYGGDYETLVETVTNSRFGVMPAFGQRLEPAEIKAVAAYVHQLGGGE